MEISSFQIEKAEKIKTQQAVAEVGQQLVGQLEDEKNYPSIVQQITQIPWGHNLKIISKCQNVEEALFYVQGTISNNWSRNVLVHQIESGLYERKGKGQ